MSFRLRPTVDVEPAVAALQDARRIVRRAIVRMTIRSWWARSRGPTAAILVPISIAVWAVKWHDVRMAELERDNQAMRAMLLADRQQTTFIVSGCGREQLTGELARASADFDYFRYLVARQR